MMVRVILAWACSLVLALSGGTIARAETWPPKVHPDAKWESLGGIVSGDLSCTSWGRNRLDCFGRGADGALWHIARTGEPPQWWPWESLGGAIQFWPECISPAENRIDCFARGTDDALWHKQWDGAGWHEWESLGGILTGLISCVTPNSKRIDCFSRATDLSLVQISWTANGGWSGWQNLGGKIGGEVDCFVRGTKMSCTATGEDGGLWRRVLTGAQWGDWESIGGAFSGGFDCEAIHDTETCLGIGTDRALWANAKGVWKKAGGSGLKSTPACSNTTSSSSSVCVVRGADDAVYQCNFVKGGYCEYWIGMGGTIASRPECTKVERGIGGKLWAAYLCVARAPDDSVWFLSLSDYPPKGDWWDHL